MDAGLKLSGPLCLSLLIASGRFLPFAKDYNRPKTDVEGEHMRSMADLSQNEKPESSATAAWPYEA